LADDLPSPLQDELKTLEHLDDDALWQVAQRQLPPTRQRLYSHLLAKQTQRPLTVPEHEKLHALGEQARLLTLQAAHAYMVLKWRGHRIPTLKEMQRAE
jgi:hypothetical protein